MSHPLSIPKKNQEPRKLSVFLCHSSDDGPEVRSLHEFLVSKGVDAWLDINKILPGEDWEMKIEEALEEIDATIVLLSERLINKTGYVQKELRQTLAMAERQPQGALFLIPARLENCDIPRVLSRWQSVDLFERNGKERLLRALEKRADQLRNQGGRGTEATGQQSRGRRAQQSDNNLPPRSGDLLGRKSDFDHVMRGLRSRCPLITIEGFAGVGKTSLAIEVGHACLSNPDHAPVETALFEYVVWISAKVKPEQKRWMEDVLNVIATTTHFSAIKQQSYDDKIFQIDQLLRKHKVLVIIDNFETIDDPDLTAWLESIPEPSKAIITTKEIQSHQNAWSVSLKGLRPAEGRILLRQYAASIRLTFIDRVSSKTLEELSKATGGNPQAMWLALGLVRGGAVDLGQVIDRLNGSNPDRLIDRLFESLFSQSWARLSDKAQKVLLVMPLFVGVNSIRRDALQAATGFTYHDFTEGLNGCVNFGLLEVDYDQHRFVVHPMTRSFARAQLNTWPNWEIQCWRRCREYFLGLVKKSVIREKPPISYWNALVSDRMIDIDPEWPSILEVLKWADQNRQDELLVDLVLLLVHYMDSRLLNQERLEYVSKAIDALERLGRKEDEALLHIDALGWTCVEVGDLKKAYDEIFKGFRIAEDFAHEKREDLMALGLAWRARVRLEMKEHQRAAELIGQALAIECSPWIKSRVNMAAGDIALKEDRPEDALAFYEQAEAEMKEYDGEGHGYQIAPRIGLAYLGKGDLDRAAEKFNELIGIDQIPIGKLYAEYGLAMVAYKRGNLDEARRMIERIKAELSRRTKSNLLQKLISSQEAKLPGLSGDPEMPDDEPLEIGGAPVVTLERPEPPDPSRPAFVRAQILPGRGMMILQIHAYLPGRGVAALLDAPPLEEARVILDGEAGDFVGNKSYAMGGALLVPYANRIRGRLSPDGRTIETDLPGRRVRLPANAGGKRPGAERYAMHGLILASRVGEVRRRTTDGADSVSATLQAGDFGGRWVSETEITFEEVLESEAFTLTARARNTGDEVTHLGIGWHPYFVFPSGRREGALLRIPARSRVLVNDYDEVLPTGEVVPVAGTPYDFSRPGGRALGGLYLDDCFVDLERTPEGYTVAEIVDPAASYGLRIVATSPEVRAIQVYAPPEKAFVALEPQLNWADPFGPQWGPDVETGMVRLAPGEPPVVYSVRLELFTPAFQN